MTSTLRNKLRRQLSDINERLARLDYKIAQFDNGAGGDGFALESEKNELEIRRDDLEERILSGK